VNSVTAKQDELAESWHWKQLPNCWNPISFVSGRWA